MRNKVRKYVKILMWNVLRFIFSPFIRVDNCLMLFGTAIEKFADNPKYLFLYVANNEKKFKPVWITNNEEILKKLKYQGYEAVKRDSFRAFLLAMRAKYFFFSHNIEDVFYLKRKETIAVNLWHGSPLKKMGFDTQVDLKWIKKRKRFFLKIPYERWDYLIVAHERFIPHFKSSMQLPAEKILPFGLPRVDLLWEVKRNEKKLLEVKGKVCGFFGLKNSEKIILYAPTFRDTEMLADKFRKELKLIIPKMKEILKKKGYRLLLRLHPFNEVSLNKEFIDNQVILDATEYEDIQELLAVSDVLITDYSSSMFDFTVLERPIILYMFDEKEYKRVRGGFYNVLDKKCFYIVNTSKELFFILNNIDNLELVAKCSKFYNKIEASRNIVRFLKDLEREL